MSIEEGELKTFDDHEEFEFTHKCTQCGRKSVEKTTNERCGMKQPDGRECNGKFIPLEAETNERD